MCVRVCVLRLPWRQVYTVEEQRMLAQLNVEEARNREAQMMAQFRKMIAERTEKTRQLKSPDE